MSFPSTTKIIYFNFVGLKKNGEAYYSFEINFYFGFI